MSFFVPSVYSLKKNQKIPIDWEYVLSFGCIYGFNKTTFSKKNGSLFSSFPFLCYFKISSANPRYKYKQYIK